MMLFLCSSSLSWSFFLLLINIIDYSKCIILHRNNKEETNRTNCFSTSSPQKKEKKGRNNSFYNYIRIPLQ